MRQHLIRVDRNEFLLTHHPRVLQAIERLASSLAAQFMRYERPELQAEFLIHLRMALHLDVEIPGALGHGAEELLSRLFLWAKAHTSLAFVSPLTWETYFRLAAPAEFDWRPIETQRTEEGGFACNFKTLSADLTAAGGQALVLLTSPNNPTGHCAQPEAIAHLCQSFPQSFFIVDTVYDAFPSPFMKHLAHMENAVVVGSFSKFFALPGLRLGFAFGCGLPDGFGWELGFSPGWMDIARAALHEQEYYALARQEMRTFSETLYTKSFSRFRVVPSDAPFLLVEVLGEEMHEAERLQREDLSGVIPKYLHRPHYGNFVRFALGTAALNEKVERFLSAEIN